MSTYVIGDIQGCYDALMLLLKEIEFNSAKDKLIFCGDLVNRGGKSLETLRWIYAHQKSCQVTLGNHDLSLLAQYYVKRLRKPRNTEFQQIFNAADCSNLMNWLRQQKLLIHDKASKKIIVHAGIYPLWSLKRAKKEAKFIESYLQQNPNDFLKNMYGAQPNHWKKLLTGMDRARFAVNSLTRMRFLYKNNGLNFSAKGEIKDYPELTPWFRFKPYKKKKHTIVIGHWSALGLMHENNVICLDTGKVWGGKLTALKINKNIHDKQQIFQV